MPPSAPGRKPGPISRMGEVLSPLRQRASLVLLLASLLLAGSGVVEVFRTVRSHRSTAESLVRDYGAFAAWTYGRRAGEVLAATIGQTLAVVGRAGPACGPEGVFEEKESGGDAACGCSPSVLGEFAYRFRLGDDPGRIELGGRVPHEGIRRRVRRVAAERARAMSPDGRFVLAHPVLGGERAILVVARNVVRARRGAGSRADTVVFGFQVAEGGVRALLQRVYDGTDLLPPTVMPEPSPEGILSVALVRDEGEPLFVSGTDPNPRFAMDDRMAPLFGGLTARAAVLPEAADDLVIGGLPGSRLPYLLALFALAAALAVGAVLQLRREQELARLRSDFVAGVSHELRTPLAQMRLFAETLRLGRVRNDRERDWFLTNIENETLRLGHLVENVLHFSRSERRSGNGNARSVDLAGEVRDVEEAFERLVRSETGRGSRVVTRLEDGLCARVHPDSFRQVLLNFLDNAVKYGPRDQTVTIRGERVGDRIRIAVEDEGPGVPARERERIWHPFRRGEDAVGSVAVGSGIGLAVARSVAGSHGGRTWVEDVAGGGARFVVCFPAAGHSGETPAD